MRISTLPHLIINVSVLLAYYVWAWVLNACTRNPVRRRQRAIRYTSTMCRVYMKTLGFEVSTKGWENIEALKDKPCLVVANHVSYTDILVLSSLQPLVFITSVEMGNNPILGRITRVGGCLYTDRKKPVALHQEIQRFADTINEGFKVVLFPEGTSTDGKTVRDFRSSLFQVAVAAQTTIQPVCIRYLTIDGKPMDDGNRDIVCWYGEMEFVPHFLKLLKRRVEVEVTFLPPIPYNPELKRSQLSDQTRELILNTYHQDKGVV